MFSKNDKKVTNSLFVDCFTDQQEKQIKKVLLSPKQTVNVHLCTERTQ